MKISRGLLPKAKKGTPKKVCDERLRLEFDRLVSLINQRGGKGALLREYPELQQYTPYKPRDRQHRSPEEQAIHILVNKHKVSERTVRYALSNRPLSLPRSTAKKE